MIIIDTLRRANETVRLIDLLNMAKDRMKESLQARADEGKVHTYILTLIITHFHTYIPIYIFRVR